MASFTPRMTTTTEMATETRMMTAGMDPPRDRGCNPNASDVGQEVRRGPAIVERRG